jgi:hypothetical protein
MAGIARTKLVEAVRGLLSEATTVRDHQRDQGPEFTSWFTRIELLVSDLGARGKVFDDRLRKVQDPETYRTRLGHAIDRNPRLDGDSTRVGWMIDGAVGVLQAIEQAIKADLLSVIEDGVASDVYGDVLTEAAGLLKGNHLACASILLRVGLENGLRRAARREGMVEVDKATASGVNVWLWKDRAWYPKASHNAVEGWLAIGNAFAHPSEETKLYTHQQVAKAIEDVRSFLGGLLA